MIRILLVDDHEVVRRGLRQLLTEAYPDAEFGEAGTLPAAREALALEPWRSQAKCSSASGNSA